MNRPVFPEAPDGVSTGFVQRSELPLLVGGEVVDRLVGSLVVEPVDPYEWVTLAPCLTSLFKLRCMRLLRLSSCASRADYVVR
jgi:hypothetical protein